MKAILLAALIVLIGSCRSSNRSAKVAFVTTTFFGPQGPGTIDPLVGRVRIMFNGAQSIQGVPLIRSIRDSSGERSFIEIKHYSFLDTERNICKNYKTLSDTASVFSHYPDIDSVSVDGGWNFYSRAPFLYDKARELADTVIGNTKYERLRVDRNRLSNEFYLIFYSLARNTRWPMKLFPGVSDSLGRTIVRDDTYFRGKLFMTRELTFVSDTLSENELRIFSRWGK